MTCGVVRCRGPSYGSVSARVGPALRSSAKGAAPRPGHERRFHRHGVICPSGGLLTGVSSPVCKNISVSTHPKSSLELWPSHPTRGALAIVTNAGRDAVDAAASCAQRGCRAGDEPVSDRQHADERCCCVRRSRVVLTPRRWCQVREVKSAQPGLDKTISVERRWQESPVTGESTK
jgi:hypothetical protein